MTGRIQSAWKHLTVDLSFLRRIHQHGSRSDDCCNSRSVHRTASLKHKTGRQFHWRWQTFKNLLPKLQFLLKIRISGITDDFILTFVSNLLFKYTTSFCVTSEILLSTTLKQIWRIGCIDAWHPDSFIATIRLDNRSEMMSASQFDAVKWCVSCLTTASHVGLTISAKTYFNHSSMCLATDTRMHASCPAPPTKNQSNDSGTLLPLEPGNSLGVPKSQITSSTGTWLHGILISNSSSVPFKTVFLSFIFFPVKSDMYFIKACYDISTINTLWVFGYLCWLLFFKFGY